MPADVVGMIGVALLAFALGGLVGARKGISPVLLHPAVIVAIIALVALVASQMLPRYETIERGYVFDRWTGEVR